MLNIHPDNMSLDIVLPLGVDRTLTVFASGAYEAGRFSALRESGRHHFQPLVHEHLTRPRGALASRDPALASPAKRARRESLYLAPLDRPRTGRRAPQPTLRHPIHGEIGALTRTSNSFEAQH